MPKPLAAARIDTPVGPMIAVGDELALHALEFSDAGDLDRGIAELCARFETAVVAGRSATVTQMESELAAYFRREPVHFSVPLERRGTGFQNAVWNALLEIPLGEVRSYADIARAIGQPSALRAVAQANGANPFPIVIPCHRVINTGGDLGGYGGGLPRKRWLLAHEQDMIGSADAFELK